MTNLLLAALLVLASAHVRAEPVPAKFDLSTYAVAANRVDVGGGRRMNLLCSGSGSPTVVFESALGGAAWGWAVVHAEVARRTRACVYDRAGIGFSDASGRPGTAAHAVEDLAQLLHRADVKPPYVLVGASYGAMVVRLFAAKRPREVFGLVLVDGHHEDEFERINRLSSGKYRQMMDSETESYRACAAASQAGIRPGSDEFRSCVGPPPGFADRRLAAAHLAQSLSPAYWDSALSEMQNLNSASASQIREVRQHLGPLPVLALVRSISPFDTPGKKPSAVSVAVERENVRMQRETAMLSDAGNIRVIARAGHHIYLDRPTAVAQAVLEVAGR
jgi:pimeloyl-ACP methyl ester carboxylesterase